MLDKKQLEIMRNADITEVDPASLVDIDTIKIDASLPAASRMESYIEQVKNPYCFLCGATPVRIRFASGKKTLAGSLGDYFIGLK